MTRTTDTRDEGDVERRRPPRRPLDRRHDRFHVHRRDDYPLAQRRAARHDYPN